MKTNCDFVSLGSVALIYNGNSINAEYKKKHFLGVDKGYPFIATKDVGFNGFIDYENGVKIPFDTDYKVADSDSVFICAEGGSAGKKIGYITQQVCFGNKLFCIKPKQNILKGKYIYYYLQSVFFQIQFQSLLTGLIGGVSASKFKNISIPVPPLSEQQRIVEQLDAEFAKIDAIKQNAEKQLQWAKDLFQSALKDLLTPKEGWEEKKFGSIYDVRDGTHDSPRYIEKGYPLVTSKNLKNGNIDFTKINYISEFDYKKINERSKVDVGDVLLAMIGTIGNPVLVVDEPFYAIKNIALFKVPKNQSGKYLKYLLSSQFILDKFYSESNGANQKFVGLGYLRNFKFPIPSFEEQQIIAEKLDLLSEKVKELQSNYEQMVVLCNDLKQSILKDIFG